MTITKEEHLQNVAKFFGCTIEQLKAQYLRNAKTLEVMYNKAIATGKKVNGCTAESLKADMEKLYELAK